MSEFKLDLLAVPNQSFNTTLNGQNVRIEIRTFRGLAYLSLSQNGKYLASGVKCIPNEGLLTAPVRRLINGNLKFRCRTDDYPNYKDFDSTDCQLIYEVGE